MVFTRELKKYINSLQYVKYRQKYNKFIAEGPKICMEFLASDRYEIEYIICKKKFYDLNESHLAKFSGKTIVCNDTELKSISSLRSPNKILIVATLPNLEKSTEPRLDDWVIYCDHIQDPGNMGAIMRIADWFGFEGIWASPDSVDFFNPKVVQSAMGAHNRIDCRTVDRGHLIEKYSDNMHVLALGGEDMRSVNFPDKGILVVGNEGKGADSAIIEAAKHKVTIKKYGGAESLNASVACGVACHYIRLSTD